MDQALSSEDLDDAIKIVLKSCPSPDDIPTGNGKASLQRPLWIEESL